jgi:hypothetical protein
VTFAATYQPNGTGEPPSDRGPLVPDTYLPPEEDLATIREIEQKFREAEEARRPQEENWLLCVAFEQGKQWYRWDWNTGSLVLPKAPPWRVRESFNLIKPKVELAAAALLQDIPLLDVEPMSSQRQDQLKARTGKAFLRYAHERLRWERLLASLGKWAVITGSAFTKSFWDPSQQDTQAIPVIDPMSGQQAQRLVLGEDGKPKLEPLWQGSRRHVGQVATQFCSPFEIYPEPGVQSFADANWVIHAKVRTLKYIREAYPEVGPYVGGGASASTPGYIERRVSDIMDGGSGTTSVSRSENTAVLLEYWEKPCPKYPQGRCITVCDGRLLKQRALPYPHLIERRSLPFTQFPYDPSDLSPWPRGLVEFLVPPQKAYNRIWSEILGILILTGQPKVLWPAGGGLVPTGPTNQPGEILKYFASQGGQKPEYWVPPGVTPGMFEALREIKADLEDISNRHMVSSGETPTNVTAGVAIQLLQEADNQAFGPKRSLFHDSFGEMGMHTLSLAAAFYDEARLGWTIGEENDERNPAAFSRMDLPSYADVRTVASSKLPMSRAAKRQEVFDLYQMGLLGQPGSPEAARIVLRRIEFGDVEKIAEEIEGQQQRQAQQAMMMELAKLQAQQQGQMQLQGQKGEQQRALAEETDTRMEEREAAGSERALAMDLMRQELMPAPPAPKAGRGR